MSQAFRPNHWEYRKYHAIAITLLTVVFLSTLGCFVVQDVVGILHHAYLPAIIFAILYVPGITMTCWSYYATVFAYVWLPDSIDDVCDSQTLQLTYR